MPPFAQHEPQMVIARSYPMSGQLSGQYSVTRVYLGSVNAESLGTGMAEGRIVFYDQAPTPRPPPVPFPSKAEVLSDLDNFGVSAIGYFVIDAAIERTG